MPVAEADAGSMAAEGEQREAAGGASFIGDDAYPTAFALRGSKAGFESCSL